MAERSLSIHFQDTNGDQFYSSFNDINPLLNDTRLGVFIGTVADLTAGTLVKTTVTDKHDIIPSVDPDDSLNGGE